MRYNLPADQPMPWQISLVSHADDLHQKVVIIKPDVLKPEYQLATRQLYLCTGGFGASPNSRGSACFCTNLFSGKHSRFERSDILATLEADAVPKWAQEKLREALQSQQKKDKSKELYQNHGCHGIIPLRQSLPESCFSTLEATGELIVITKGEKGYSPTDVFPQNTSPKEGAAALNAANGVTKAQEAAMVAGSMFGWEMPAANPKNYDALGQPIKNQRRSYAAER